MRPMTAFGIRSSSAQKDPSRPALAIWVSQILRRLRVVPGRRLPSPAQRLQHPDAGGRFLDQRGQVALLILNLAGEHPVAFLEPEANRQHGREHDAGDQAEPPVEVDQQRDHRQERHHVGDQEDQAETREPAN